MVCMILIWNCVLEIEIVDMSRVMILDICELLMVGVVKKILEILSRRSQAKMHRYIYIHCVRCCDIISRLM